MDRERGRAGGGLYGLYGVIREGLERERVPASVRERNIDRRDGEGEVENDGKEMEMEKENRDRRANDRG